MPCYYYMELDDYDVKRLLFELSARRGMIRGNDVWIEAFLVRLQQTVEAEREARATER